MELFIKRFIDLLDEMVPVTMVHTLVEQPLGAVLHDYYITIHARLDLVDENSPFVEIELYPYETNKIAALFAYTYPKKSIFLSEEALIEEWQKSANAKVEHVLPLDKEEDDYYEMFYEETYQIKENHAEMDEFIHQKVPEIKHWLAIGGYEEAREGLE